MNRDLSDRTIEWIPVAPAPPDHEDAEQRRIIAKAARLRRSLGPSILSDAPVSIEIAGEARHPVVSLLMTLDEALEQIGLPAIPGTTPDEELVGLLAYAAEIEHGLMVQYLYSTYAAKNVSIQGILRRIAREEMGHFITVQNLLLAAGRPMHLQRYDWQTRQQFAPFPFRLEPLTRSSIARYVIAEMPDMTHIDDEQQVVLLDILRDVEDAKSLVPQRVGLLYAKIYWLLRKNDSPLVPPAAEPWDAFPVERLARNPKLAGRHVSESLLGDNAAMQGHPEHWQRNNTDIIVAPIAGRGEALAAIAEIAEQGEGFGETPQGHFDQFVDAYRLAKGQTDIGHAVPVNPSVTATSASGHGDVINSPDGVGLAKLADQLYELVLLTLELHARVPGGSDVRARIAEASLDLMMLGLKSIGELIVTVERSTLEPDPPINVAHIPFSRPVSIDTLSTLQPEEVRALTVALLDEAIVAAEAFAASTTKTHRKRKVQAVANNLRSKIGPALDGSAA